jgi:hypothetical protein
MLCLVCARKMVGSPTLLSACPQCREELNGELAEDLERQFSGTSIAVLASLNSWEIRWIAEYLTRSGGYKKLRDMMWERYYMAGNPSCRARFEAEKACVRAMKDSQDPRTPGNTKILDECVKELVDLGRRCCTKCNEAALRCRLRVIGGRREYGKMARTLRESVDGPAGGGGALNEPFELRLMTIAMEELAGFEARFAVHGTKPVLSAEDIVFAREIAQRAATLATRCLSRTSDIYLEVSALYTVFHCSFESVDPDAREQQEVAWFHKLKALRDTAEIVHGFDSPAAQVVYHTMQIRVEDKEAIRSMSARRLLANAGVSPSPEELHERIQILFDVFAAVVPMTGDEVVAATEDLVSLLMFAKVWGVDRIIYHTAIAVVHAFLRTAYFDEGFAGLLDTLAIDLGYSMQGRTTAEVVVAEGTDAAIKCMREHADRGLEPHAPAWLEASFTAFYGALGGEDARQARILTALYEFGKEHNGGNDLTARQCVVMGNIFKHKAACATALEQLQKMRWGWCGSFESPKWNGVTIACKDLDPDPDR